MPSVGLATVLCFWVMRSTSYNAIDYNRCVLIVVVVVVHIVNFGRLYPGVQQAMAVTVMPAFLVITGYLVNVDKTWRRFLVYLSGIILPYVIMSLGYALLSLYLPVRDGIADGRPSTLLHMLLAAPIGPYWYFHTMAVCSVLYYVSFKTVRRWGDAAVFFVFASLLVLVSKYADVVSFRFALSFCIGVGARLFGVGFSKCFRPSVLAVVPIVLLVVALPSPSLWDDVSVLLIAVCFICFCSWCFEGRTGRIVDVAGYIGRNTFPIYVFHPIFTMAAKFMLPAFRFDPTGLLHAAFTVVLCVAGSLALALVMDKTRLSYCFGRKYILR